MHNVAFDCTYIVIAISVLMASVAGTWAAITWAERLPTSGRSISHVDLELRSRRVGRMKHLVMAMVIVTFHCSYMLFAAVLCSQHSLLGYTWPFRVTVGIVVSLLVAWCCWEFELIRHLVVVVKQHINYK